MRKYLRWRWSYTWEITRQMYSSMDCHASRYSTCNHLHQVQVRELTETDDKIPSHLKARTFRELQNIILYYILTLWKLMLSSKGMKSLALVDLSNVKMLRQTGRRMRAMLSLRVSAAPLAVVRQWPMTWKAAFCLYWRNFQVKRPSMAEIQRRRMKALCQLSRRRENNLLMKTLLKLWLHPIPTLLVLRGLL